MTLLEECLKALREMRSARSIAESKPDLSTPEDYALADRLMHTALQRAEREIGRKRNVVQMK
jgi:hypothetical protein